MPRHSPYALIRLNFFCLVLSIFSWIAWVSWTFLFRFVNSCEKVLSFFVLNCFSTFRWNCILPKLERPIISTSDLVKFICPLICSFLTLQYSLFGFQWTYFLRFVRFDLISHRVGIFDLSATSPSFGRGNVPLVGSSGLEPPTSRLSGARSNQLSYDPIFQGWASKLNSESKILSLKLSDTTHESWLTWRISLERRWSSRTFRYGNLVTT